MIPPYPLAWPVGRLRTKFRRSSAFTSRRDSGFRRAGHSIEEARVFVCAELVKWRVSENDLCISSNLILRMDGFPRSGQPEPADPGTAVYFRRKAHDYVLACDKWSRVACNLWAIGKHMEAVRGQERWGVESQEQALSHFLALPERGAGPAWWDVLEVSSAPSRDAVRAAFRKKSLVAHPDRGGTAEEWELLNNAYQQADAYFAGQSVIL